jgi:threonyl-tRNA synthetase
MIRDPFHPLILARQTAAEALAAAACELFPQTALRGGEGTSKLFFYDFAFPFSFLSEFLPQLEEKMRRLLKQEGLFKILEMIPSNAADLLKHHGQFLLAEEVASVERALVTLVQRGDFADWCEAPLLEEWDERYAFKLVEFYPLLLSDGQELIRVVGMLEEDKTALKAAVKKAPSFARGCHLNLLEEENLFAPALEEGCWSWLPRGEVMKKTLVQWWEEQMGHQNFELMTTPPHQFAEDEKKPDLSLLASHQRYWEKVGKGKIAEMSYLTSASNPSLKNGLFESRAGICDRAHAFVSDEELFQECISSLQFIVKIPKILGFEFQIILYTGNVGIQKGASKEAKNYQLLQSVLKESGLEYLAIRDPGSEYASRIQLQISDGLGRWWDGPFIEIDKNQGIKSGFTCVTLSAFYSLERLVALCLEKYQGLWPFWLSPEQVRIIPLTDEGRDYALEVHRKLKDAGIRATWDEGREPLKTRLHRALKEKVPFAALIGKREKESNCISFRTLRSSQDEKRGIEEFIDMMRELNRSKDSELKN